jgi:Spy/CpxP family protein refolding chaperone
MNAESWFNRNTLGIRILPARLREVFLHLGVNFRAAAPSKHPELVFGSQAVPSKGGHASMIRSKNIFVAVVLTGLMGLSVVAQAQQPGQPGQGRGQGRGQRGQASLATLPIDTVAKLLSLTADQKTKVAAIQTKLQEDSRALRPQQGQQPDPAARQKRAELNTEAIKQIDAILTDEQKKKFSSARDEMAVLRAVGAPMGMMGELKFSDEQKKKIADMQKENQAKLQGLSREERQAKGREMQQEMRTKVEALLTAEQKAQIEKYVKEHPQGRRARPPF